MATKQTTDEGQILQSIDGKLRLLRKEDFQQHLEDNDYEVEVELWMLNELKNRNDWIYQNTRKKLKAFEGKPILISYKNGQLGAGHEMDEVLDRNGQVSQSFMSASAERIVGVLGGSDSIRTEIDENGVEWVVGKGKIFGFYAPELAKRLLGETGSLKDEMRISIETLIYDMRRDGNVEIYTDWTVLGVTILGDNVTEAVAGANIRALAALTEEKIQEMTLRVAAANSARKHQNKSATKEKKRSKTMKSSDIQKHFAGCTVLAVDGENVAFLDENGSACVANVSENDESVTFGDAVKANASLTFSAGEASVDVPFAAYNENVQKLSTRINELEKQLSEANGNVEAAQKTIEQMKAVETARRLEAVKNAIKERLSSIIKLHENEISADLCDDMLTDNALAEYCNLEKDGKWCGIEAARREVNSRAMDKLCEADIKKNNASRKSFVWDRVSESTQNSGGVEEMLARMNKVTNR